MLHAPVETLQHKGATTGGLEGPDPQLSGGPPTFDTAFL